MNEEPLEERVICINHLYKHKIDLSTKSHGDCRYCKLDENNIKCSGYYPIKLYGDGNNEKENKC